MPTPDLNRLYGDELEALGKSVRKAKQDIENDILEEKRRRSHTRRRKFLTPKDLKKADPQKVIDLAHFIGDEVSDLIHKILDEEGINGWALGAGTELYEAVYKWFETFFPGKRYYTLLPKSRKKKSSEKKSKD